MFQIFDSDTICAVSTAPGVGGIAIIRVSGPDAISITDKIWKGKKLAGVESHTAHLGTIVDPQHPGEPLDTAVTTIFRGPRSFTGEDVVEISVHGSRWIQRELVNLLIRSGCKAAQPGEFTRRAFANGRLDLAQAEAIADVIAASSRSAHRLAASQMRGEFSKHIAELRDQLIEIASLLELELDFSEEDVEFASRQKLRELAETLYKKISSLASSFSTGSVLKDGIPVAIVGEPNAGKSTLLNQLLHDNRAIVSDIPGTTRDTIEDTMEIDGTLYRFIDTAGIRETFDSIESLGIERSYSAIAKAKIVLWLVTPKISATDFTTIGLNIKKHLTEDAKLIVVLNKIDTISDTEIDATSVNLCNEFVDSPHSLCENNIHASFQTLVDFFSQHDKNQTNVIDKLIYISAKNGQNIENIISELRKCSSAESLEDADMIVTNARHYEALIHAQDSIHRVIQGLNNNLSGDFIAQDLRETIHYLSTITGSITTSDLLQTIFSRFCIGK